MRTLYLHIGAEKTGTTTLQHVLASNADVLAARGVHYLQSAGWLNARMIPAWCVNDDVYDDFFLDHQIRDQAGRDAFKAQFHAAFTAELDALDPTVHTVIASSEHLHSRVVTEAAVRRVADLVQPFFDRIQIICYLREQAATCSSHYSTEIKFGITTPFRDFMANCHPGNIYYNHLDMLANWRAVFGTEALCVRVFDKRRLDGGDLITDFFNQIDLALGAAVRRPEAALNVSLNPLGEVVGRALNIAVPRYNSDGTVNQQRLRAVAQLEQSFQGPGFAIEPSQARKIYDAFRASNREVSRLYLGKKADLFVYKASPYASMLIVDNHAEALADVLRAFTNEPIVLPDRTADPLRDAAVVLEATRPDLALQLMELAAIARPAGPFIQQKLKDYRASAHK